MDTILYLVVTQECNLRCEYCIYSDKYPQSTTYSKKEMDRETARKGIDILFDIQKEKNSNGREKIFITSIGRDIFKNKQLVVLVDRTTASSAEYIFLQALKKRFNCLTIGDDTAGMSGQARQFGLCNNIVLQVTTKKYLKEGKVVGSVQPDIRVPHIIDE